MPTAQVTSFECDLTDNTDANVQLSGLQRHNKYIEHAAEEEASMSRSEQWLSSEPIMLPLGGATQGPCRTYTA